MARISMIRVVIIMTIEANVLYSDDLRQENSILNIPWGWSSDVPIEATFFYLDPSDCDYLGVVSNKVISLVNYRFPNLVPWVFAGTRTWSEKNRITRYNGLWKSMRSCGLRVPVESKTTDEIEVNSEFGRKFFGAFELASFDLSRITSAALEQFCFYLVFVPVDLKLDPFLKMEWSGNILKDGEFLNSVLSSGCLTLGKVGGFGENVGVVLMWKRGEIPNEDSFCLQGALRIE